MQNLKKFISAEYWREIMAIVGSLTAIGIVTVNPEVLDILPGQIEVAAAAVVAVIGSLLRMFRKTES